MKLGVSNLAWSAPAEDRAFALVAEAGFSGIEVAPTRVADWPELDAPKLDAYRRKCEAAGLVVSSLQAIFFNCPEARLLADEAGFEAMLAQLRRVADIGAALGAETAVFGAPRSRLRCALSRAEAGKLAVDRLRRLGDVLLPSGLALGMEPVPAYYGADFLESVADTAALVKACGHPSIRLHLDCACIQLGGDDAPAAIARYAGSAVHYHAAEPDLGPFAEPRCDHSAAAAALRTKGYDGWVVIEMRQQGEDGLAALGEALQLVGSTYGV